MTGTGAAHVYDVFICHASENKEAVALPLAKALRDRGVVVWIDESELQLGDSLRQKIDEGLRSSRFGIVLLSPVFFAKQWAQKELDGLTEIEVRAGCVVILPVLVDMTPAQLAEHSPVLAGKRSATWDDPDAVVAEVLRRLEQVPKSPAAAAWPGTTTADSVASVDNLVTQAKSYMAANNQIKLNDLLAQSLLAARSQIGEWPFGGTRSDLNALVKRIDNATEVVSSLVATCSYYGNESTDTIWLPTLQRWATRPGVSGTVAFIDLLYYPATRLMYAAGVAMMAKDRLKAAEKMLRMTVGVPTSGLDGPLSSELLARRSLSGLVEQDPKDVTSEHVYSLVAPQLEHCLFLSSEAAMQAYERFEMLLFLVSTDCREAGLDASNLSTGLIRSTGSAFSRRARPAAELSTSAAYEQHPWTQAGIFDSDQERLVQSLLTFEQYFAATHPGPFRLPNGF